MRVDLAFEGDKLGLSGGFLHLIPFLLVAVPSFGHSHRHRQTDYSEVDDDISGDELHVVQPWPWPRSSFRPWPRPAWPKFGPFGPSFGSAWASGPEIGTSGPTSRSARASGPEIGVSGPTSGSARASGPEIGVYGPTNRSAWASGPAAIKIGPETVLNRRESVPEKEMHGQSGKCHKQDVPKYEPGELLLVQIVLDEEEVVDIEHYEKRNQRYSEPGVIHSSMKRMSWPWREEWHAEQHHPDGDVQQPCVVPCAFVLSHTTRI